MKVRGYRIELGEIEAAIGRYPERARERRRRPHRHARRPPPRRLRRRRRTPEPARAPTRVGRGVGRDLPAPATTADPTFDIVGLEQQLHRRADPGRRRCASGSTTPSRASARLSPRRVLEIGCGTGLLLFRVAPHCERYVGVDLAQHALDRIAAALPGAGLTNVELHQGAAHERGRARRRPLRHHRRSTRWRSTSPTPTTSSTSSTPALDLLEPGGSLFLGDLRSRDHQPLFAAADRAGAGAGVDDGRRAGRPGPRSAPPATRSWSSIPASSTPWRRAAPTSPTSRSGSSRDGPTTR